MAGQVADQFGRERPAAGRSLRPIGVFWDIENCQIPKGKAATSVVHCIRQNFIDGYSEEEFLCVCDIRKESKDVIHELNLAQVTVVHINATCKNAADDKLKQCMRRFVDTHGPQATLMLISGDVNFSTELSDFRHRRKVHIILVHGSWAPEALTVCAHKCYSYSSLVATVPLRSHTKGQSKFCEVVVNDLPEDKDSGLVQNRLRQLSDNCGGRVVTITGTTAYLRFPTTDSARRACKRMDGEDVFGSKISVSLHMGRKVGSKQSCCNEPGIAGGASSVAHKLPRQSNSPREDQVISHTSFSGRWDTWYSAMGESMSADPLSKNVGRVSPFLFSGKKTRDQECQGHSNRSNVHLVPCRMSPSSPVLPPPCAPERWHNGRGTERNTCMFDTDRPTGCARPGNAVELHVTNIDCRSTQVKDLKKLLLAYFQEHVMVQHISLVLQEDGTLHAHVQVASMNDARVAVSKLHRRLIGRRRISVAIVEDGKSHMTTSTSNRGQKSLGLQLVELLRDAPRGSLPLFRLKELFENRYNSCISVSEIQKLHDKVTIVDEPSGRMVVLNGKLRCQNSSPHVIRRSSVLPEHEKPCCEQPASPVLGLIDGWAQWEKTPELLPKVCISSATLGPRVHALLDRHNGSLPINSFLACYEAEFGPIPRISDRELWCEGSVYLEHLIASLPGVHIDTCYPLKIKTITWIENGKESKAETSYRNKCLGKPLKQLASETVELLKAQPNSCMALHFFVPAYNQHFNRQCRITDYGFTRLPDLLHAISHVVQILGQGQNRLLTLTHKVQLDRFICDIMQVLGMQPNKEVSFSDLQEMYQRCHHHPLVVADYGSCYLEDLLADASASLLVLSQGNEKLVSLRRNEGDGRKPSLEELERRRQFGCEVVDMLKHSPNCSILFHKFAPAYHHHFGRQCRIADYGCTKLAELLATISDIVQVVGEGESRSVQLCLPQRLQIERERITATLDASCEDSVTKQMLKEAYAAHHGFPLHWEGLGFESLESFLLSLGDTIQVEETGQLHVMDRRNFQKEMSRIVSLLMERFDGSMDLEELWQLHHSCYGTYPQMHVVKHLEAKQTAWVDRTEGRIVLLPLHLVARNIISLVQQHGGQLPLKNLEELFFRRFGTAIMPSRYKFAGMETMLNALPEYFLLEGHRENQIVRLQQSFASPEAQPQSTQESSREPELLLALHHSPQDLLSSPIPSCVPSPVLSPLTTSAPSSGDLMLFEAAQEVGNSLKILDLAPQSPESERENRSTCCCQDCTSISPLSFTDQLGAPGSSSQSRKTRLAARFSVPLQP